MMRKKGDGSLLEAREARLTLKPPSRKDDKGIGILSKGKRDRVKQVKNALYTPVEY